MIHSFFMMIFTQAQDLHFSLVFPWATFSLFLIKEKLKIVRSKNFFTYRSGSNGDCNNKSDKKMSSKKTSSDNSIKKFGEISSGGASGSRKLKRKVDEISLNKSSRSEIDGKNNVKGKKTSIFNSVALIDTLQGCRKYGAQRKKRVLQNRFVYRKVSYLLSRNLISCALFFRQPILPHFVRIPKSQFFTLVSPITIHL